MDQLNYETKRSGKADPDVALAKALGQWPPAPSPRQRRKIDLAKIDLKTSGAGAAAPASVEVLARELGLKLGEQNELTIRRIKRGKGYAFVRANGAHIRDAKTIRRLHAMAVPPAYREVRYAVDPALHLQAVGVDAA